MNQIEFIIIHDQPIPENLKLKSCEQNRFDISARSIIAASQAIKNFLPAKIVFMFECVSPIKYCPSIIWESEIDNNVDELEIVKRIVNEREKVIQNICFAEYILFKQNIIVLNEFGNDFTNSQTL